MQVTKKILAPLILMILLAGVAGILSAREVSIIRSQKIKSAANSSDLTNE